MKETLPCFVLTAGIRHSVHVSKWIFTDFVRKHSDYTKYLCYIYKYSSVLESFVDLNHKRNRLCITTLEDSPSYRFFFSWLLMISIMSLIFLTFASPHPSVGSVTFLDLDSSMLKGYPVTSPLLVSLCVELPGFCHIVLLSYSIISVKCCLSLWQSDQISGVGVSLALMQIIYSAVTLMSS